MRPQAERLGILRIEVLFDELRPEEACGPHLGDFHERVHANRPEEGEARRKGVHVEARRHTGADILNAICQRVGQLKVC